MSDPRAGHDACDLYQLENAVSRVECRTLILAHDKDPHSFKDLGEFTRRLPAAEVVVLEGGMVPLELHPDRVAQIIRDFVTRQPPGA